MLHSFDLVLFEIQAFFAHQEQGYGWPAVVKQVGESAISALAAAPKTDPAQHVRQPFYYSTE
jgi:hypothetical protein